MLGDNKPKDSARSVAGEAGEGDVGAGSVGVFALDEDMLRVWRGGGEGVYDDLMQFGEVTVMRRYWVSFSIFRRK